MEADTVSALIHAATMVAAGVYLVPSFPLMTPEAGSLSLIQGHHPVCRGHYRHRDDRHQESARLSTVSATWPT